MFTQANAPDKTALQRQKRRIEKLKTQGVSRSTVFVHENCKSALADLRPHFVDPLGAETLSGLVKQLEASSKPTNVAQVNQLSPFRYPGGKTWLVPEICSWLRTFDQIPDVFVEPFAGGAMAGLTTAAEGLAFSVVLSEIDADVAAVWETIFDGSNAETDWLCGQIISFQVSLENVQKTLASDPQTRAARAFRSIIRNRMQRGGIMAAGAGLVKAGEAGRGLNSRWYPKTLAARIKTLRTLRDRISFLQDDAFCTIRHFIDNPNACFFIDPPYTAGGKKAGKRLYTHNEVDHEALFALLASVRGSVMLTYDDAPEVREMATRHGFRMQNVSMKNTHHTVMQELIILKP